MYNAVAPAKYAVSDEKTASAAPRRKTTDTGGTAMVPFDRFTFLGVGFASHTRFIPGWARKEQLDRIAPQTELWRLR